MEKSSPGQIPVARGRISDAAKFPLISFSSRSTRSRSCSTLTPTRSGHAGIVEVRSPALHAAAGDELTGDTHHHRVRWHGADHHGVSTDAAVVADLDGPENLGPRADRDPISAVWVDESCRGYDIASSGPLALAAPGASAHDDLESSVDSHRLESGGRPRP